MFDSSEGALTNERLLSPPSPTQSTQVSAYAGRAIRVDFYRTSTGARVTTSPKRSTDCPPLRRLPCRVDRTAHPRMAFDARVNGPGRSRARLVAPRRCVRGRG